MSLRKVLRSRMSKSLNFFQVMLAIVQTLLCELETLPQWRSLWRFAAGARHHTELLSVVKATQHRFLSERNSLQMKQYGLEQPRSNKGRGRAKTGGKGGGCWSILARYRKVKEITSSQKLRKNIQLEKLKRDSNGKEFWGCERSDWCTKTHNALIKAKTRN